MSLTFTFPTNVELEQVVQEYVIQPDMFMGEKILPVVESMAQKVRWDELDNERGMTAPHNMGTDPKVDKRPGSKTREYEPIAFKETDLLKENEMLRARELGTLGGVINLNREIARIVKARMDKTKIRQEMIRWQTLRGQLSINENGVKVSETFPIQTYNSLVDWDTLGTATPLRDFNAV